MFKYSISILFICLGLISINKLFPVSYVGVGIVEPLEGLSDSDLLKFWTQDIEKYPNDYIGYKERGDIYRKLKKWELAIKD